MFHIIVYRNLNSIWGTFHSNNRVPQVKKMLLDNSNSENQNSKVFNERSSHLIEWFILYDSWLGTTLVSTKILILVMCSWI